MGTWFNLNSSIFLSILYMPMRNQIRGGKYAPDEKNPKHTSEVEFKIQKCRIYIKLMQGRIHTCLEWHVKIVELTEAWSIGGVFMVFEDEFLCFNHHIRKKVCLNKECNFLTLLRSLSVFFPPFFLIPPLSFLLYLVLQDRSANLSTTCPPPPKKKNF